MKRLAIAVVLFASPAAAQTTETDCVNTGLGIRCTTRTPGPMYPTPLYVAPSTPPADNLALERLIRRVIQGSQTQPQPAPLPVSRETFTVIQDYIAKGQCADAVYYARQFNDRAALDYALTCQPK